MGLSDRVLDQLRGILDRNELEFSTDETGGVFTVPYQSTACSLEVLDWGESAVVQLRGYVLEEVSITGDRRAELLERLNTLNCEGAFGTLWLRADEPGVVMLEHHLLGDDLDDTELMHALRSVLERADPLGGELSTTFGTGQTWAQVEVRSRSQEDDTTIEA